MEKTIIYKTQLYILHYGLHLRGLTGNGKVKEWYFDL